MKNVFCFFNKLTALRKKNNTIFWLQIAGLSHLTSQL
jgi:hypothetical protein